MKGWGQSRHPSGDLLARHTGRQRVCDAVDPVGEPGGSCVWAVVGEEKSLKRWALTAKLAPETASGVLISALGTLKT